MRFEYSDHELDIFDGDDDEYGVFNYCKSMAGHTLMLNPDWELVPQELNPKCLFLIRKKEKK